MLVPRRRLHSGLRTLLLLATAAAVLFGWARVQFNWIAEREQARAWMAAEPVSWYSPSLRGAAKQASAPLSLRLFGERGIVAIGIEPTRGGKQPRYDIPTLAQLFPEARVGLSKEGRLVQASVPSR